jgi:hypothetical protein
MKLQAEIEQPQTATPPIRATVESWDRGPGNKVHYHLFESLEEAQEFERGAVAAGERRYLHMVGCGWVFHKMRTQ